MAKVYLVRHGQARFGSDNYDNLSDLGITQSQLLGEYLASINLKPTLLINGGMQRHIQTQQHCINALVATESKPESVQYECKELPEFSEFDHQNVLQVYDNRFENPQSMKDYLSEHPSPAKAFIIAFTKAIARWQSGDFDNEYNEPWPAFTHRVINGFKKLSQSVSDDDEVLVFTSGGVISVLIMDILTIPTSQMFMINKNLYNCGLTEVEIKKSTVQLITMNEHGYFKGYKHGFATLI